MSEQESQESIAVLTAQIEELRATNNRTEQRMLEAQKREYIFSHMLSTFVVEFHAADLLLDDLISSKKLDTDFVDVWFVNRGKNVPLKTGMAMLRQQRADLLKQSNNSDIIRGIYEDIN
jgi:hypothetical protein